MLPKYIIYEGDNLKKWINLHKSLSYIKKGEHGYDKCFDVGEFDVDKIFDNINLHWTKERDDIKYRKEHNIRQESKLKVNEKIVKESVIIKVLDNDYDCNNYSDILWHKSNKLKGKEILYSVYFHLSSHNADIYLSTNKSNDINMDIRHIIEDKLVYHRDIAYLGVEDKIDKNVEFIRKIDKNLIKFPNVFKIIVFDNKDVSNISNSVKDEILNYMNIIPKLDYDDIEIDSSDIFKSNDTDVSDSEENNTKESIPDVDIDVDSDYLSKMQDEFNKIKNNKNNTIATHDFTNAYN